ncbi:hypothetical protein A2U01_0089937, partial [Trifolium medium]|nr:hypothetical protein [Trifolium medium]
MRRPSLSKSSSWSWTAPPVPVHHGSNSYCRPACCPFYCPPEAK